MMPRNRRKQRSGQKERREKQKDPDRHIQRTEHLARKAGTQARVSIELVKYGILTCEVLIRVFIKLI